MHWVGKMWSYHAKTTSKLQHHWFEAQFNRAHVASCAINKNSEVDTYHRIVAFIENVLRFVQHWRLFDVYFLGYICLPHSFKWQHLLFLSFGHSIALRKIASSNLILVFGSTFRKSGYDRKKEREKHNEIRETRAADRPMHTLIYADQKYPSVHFNCICKRTARFLTVRMNSSQAWKWKSIWHTNKITNSHTHITYTERDREREQTLANSKWIGLRQF